MRRRPLSGPESPPRPPRLPQRCSPGRRRRSGFRRRCGYRNRRAENGGTIRRKFRGTSAYAPPETETCRPARKECSIQHVETFRSTVEANLCVCPQAGVRSRIDGVDKRLTGDMYRHHAGGTGAGPRTVNADSQFSNSDCRQSEQICSGSVPSAVHGRTALAYVSRRCAAFWRVCPLRGNRIKNGGKPCVASRRYFLRKRSTGKKRGAP